MESDDWMPPDDDTDDDDETSYKDRSPTRYPFNINQSRSKPRADPLLGLRTILLPVPSGILNGITWLIGAAIIIIWNTFHPVIYSGDRVDLLTMIIAIFFFGLGFVFYGIKGDPLPGSRSGNPWFIVILCSALSLFLLYFFIFGK